jgi:hypothetical protein
MPLLLYQIGPLKGRKNVYIQRHDFNVFEKCGSDGKIESMNQSILGGN